MRKGVFGWTVAAAIVLLAPASAAAVIELPAVKDNTIYEPFGFSNGAGQHMFAGRNAPFGGGTIRRALVAFDVAGNLPAGATVDSVTLRLNMSMTNTGDEPVSLHRLTVDWGEGGSDAAGGEGEGAFSEVDDAEWEHAFFPNTEWTTEGGDFVAAPSATVSVGGDGRYTWSTPQMLSDVQGWLDQPETDFGWILLGNEATSQTAKRFDTRENPTPSFRPVLIVEFTPIPVPSVTARGQVILVLLFAAIGLVVLLLRSRSRAVS